MSNARAQDDDPWAAARRSMSRLEASGLRSRSLLGIAALVVSAVLVILAALMLSVNVGRLRTSFEWMQHASSVLQETSAVREALLDAGIATRSYLLTADDAYIVAHAEARRAMDRRLDTLAKLVADNPEQVRRVAELRTLITSREALLDRIGGLGPGTRDRLVAGMRGIGPVKDLRNFSSEVGGKFAAFRDAELALQRARQHRTQGAAGLTFLLGLVTALLALSAGIVGFYFLRRERAENRARELELVLTHTQRLMLMGETSLALAHELNQPLSAAGNYISALRRFLAADGALARARADDSAQKARAQVQRAGEIVRRLRNFVANGDNERSVQGVDVLFADALALLGTLDESIQLERRIEPDLPAVFVDRIQIQQVLVNLMRNALEAMRDSPRRELTLIAAAHGNDTVQICLQDSGTGLPREVAARLFKPFVTTKSNGMGVGLSICQRIVVDHGGRIWAEKASNGGALFCFTLPVARLEAAA
ncbi:MAG: ATP-binding protein [Rhizomicrobium sp.]